METNKFKFDKHFPIGLSRFAATIKQCLPIFSNSIAAGFPSPADDYIEQQLDLNQLIVKHPTATFFVRVEGDSIRDMSIQSGDILVVDRSLSPTHDKIVVAVIEGEFTIKRIQIEKNTIYLTSENSGFSRLKISSDSQFQVWGVVTYVIHKAH